jgi:hypothetical protein
MDSLERCCIVLGVTSDNEKKRALVNIYLERAREDIEAFCRDNFTEDGVDVFPKALRSVQEDIAIQYFRKRGAEGESSYTLADESASFEVTMSDSVKSRLYPYRRLFPRA